MVRCAPRYLGSRRAQRFVPATDRRATLQASLKSMLRSKKVGSMRVLVTDFAEAAITRRSDALTSSTLILARSKDLQKARRACSQGGVQPPG